jgi:hypothetical protein
MDDLTSMVQIRDRPIIFIAHSLGGLVLNQVSRIARQDYACDAKTWFKALVLASLGNEDHLLHHKYVDLSTAGICYLGTPHQGTNGADLLETMLKVQSIFFRTSTRIVKDLKPTSDYIHQLQTQYSAISANYPIVYCYETLETPHSSGISSMVSHPHL